MTGLEKIARGYTVSVRCTPDHYHIVYAPQGLQHVRANGDTPAQVPPPFEVTAQLVGEDTHFRWLNSPLDRDATPEDFEQDAAGRLRLLDGWLGRLLSLVRSIDTWAKELGWSTRVVEKPMEDSQIGRYKAPGLLMQEGVDRILLEPVGRSAPGTEGVVDLYLLPAYDDIATLYYYDDAGTCTTPLREPLPWPRFERFPRSRSPRKLSRKSLQR